MGQKVNPIGFRLGVNRGWDSVWYAKKKDFGNDLIEDFKFRAYIKKNVVNSGVSKVMIEKTSNKCFVTIYLSPQTPSQVHCQAFATGIAAAIVFPIIEVNISSICQDKCYNQ